MIRPGFVLGIARAEARLTRRLVRFWVFAVLSMILGLLAYLNFYFIHRFVSGMSASAAAITSSALRRSEAKSSPLSR